MGLGQYIKDTRSELNHVAWPTRVQTIIYTILVIAISLLVSLYLGFFDFLFTNGLGRIVESLPQQPTQEIPFDQSIDEISTTTVGTSTVQ
ncbi:MAG: preprotein translocase subunit SecE [Parcubacteria group bacterium RIFCSPHIGHO2_01_FULL_56_18]|nr:MAG: preprotein translocase subunit SecE [Parcubacteria group bacterium RIFCSPHIGHO2_01_FULL_56_18]